MSNLNFKQNQNNKFIVVRGWSRKIVIFPAH